MDMMMHTTTSTHLHLTDADPAVRQEFLENIIHNFELEQTMNLHAMTTLYAEAEIMEREAQGL